MPSPEEVAQQNIDKLLNTCDWKLSRAHRVFSLVDRDNLGDRALIPPPRDQQFVTPDDGRKFTELAA